MQISGAQRFQLALAEYQSLREESAQAREAQQSILEWSIGAIGVVFAAALATDAGASPGLVRSMVLGIVLPSLIAGATFTWMGEMMRMERAAYYLRGREPAFWVTEEDGSHTVDPDLVDEPDIRPLLWENFIAFASEGPGRRKQLVAYVGGFGIYVGSFLVSYILLLADVHGQSGMGLSDVARNLITAGVVLAVIAYLGTCIVVGRWLMETGSSAAGR